MSTHEICDATQNDEHIQALTICIINVWSFGKRKLIIDHFRYANVDTLTSQDSYIEIGVEEIVIKLLKKLSFPVNI